jgi:hypothetical protein
MEVEFSAESGSGAGEGCCATLEMASSSVAAKQILELIVILVPFGQTERRRVLGDIGDTPWKADAFFLWRMQSIRPLRSLVNLRLGKKLHEISEYSKTCV